MSHFLRFAGASLLLGCLLLGPAAAQTSTPALLDASFTAHMANDFRKAGELAERAFAVPGAQIEAGSYYNAACSWARAGETDNAFRNLSRAADESTSRPKDRRTALLDPVYVAFVAGETSAEHADAVSTRLEKLCAPRSWPFVRLHLDDACDSPGGAETMLAGLSATSVETAREHLRMRALREAARERGCSVLFTGETSERLAIRTLRSIAEGQAWALGEMVGSIVQHSPGALRQGGMSSLSRTTHRPTHGHNCTRRCPGPLPAARRRNCR